MSRLSSFLKSLSVLFILGLTTLSVSAAENILHSVEISQNGESYNLRLKADDMIHIKKRVENKNSAYFELKNITPAEDLETVYNDVADLDGVIIQQIDKSKIRIYVNGYSAARTQASVETLANIIKDKKEIVVNRPRSEYASVNPIEEYEDNDWENNGFNFEYLSNSIKNALGGMNIDYMFIISLAVIIASIAGLKKAFSKQKIQDEVIGISANNKRIFDEIAGEKYSAREELIRKMKDDAQSSQQTVNLNTNYVKPDTAMQNYAINSYNRAQNSNPYANQPINQGSTINRPQRKVVMPERQDFSSSIPNATSPYRAMRTPIEPLGQAAKKVNKNMDNMKFLESVTKIYEQSGRKDLAQGIKSNLSKQKTAI